LLDVTRGKSGKDTFSGRPVGTEEKEGKGFNHSIDAREKGGVCLVVPSPGRKGEGSRPKLSRGKREEGEGKCPQRGKGTEPNVAFSRETGGQQRGGEKGRPNNPVRWGKG